MNLTVLFHALDVDFCHRLTSTLAHFVWQGFLCAGVLGLLKSILSRRSANARFIAATATMIVLAICPVVTFRQVSIPSRYEPTSIPRSSELRDGSFPAEIGAKKISTTPEGRSFKSSSESVVDTPLAEPQQTWIALLSPYVTSAYLIGTLGMLLRLVLGVHRIRRLRRRLIPVDSQIVRVVHIAVEKLTIGWTPIVMSCEQFAVPAVIGLIRPMILLPPSLVTGLTTEQLETVLIHELAHLRRLDHLFVVLQRAIEAFLFFHPAVWYTSQQMSIERENACDDIVLACGRRPTDYIDTLLCVAELCATQQSLMNRRPGLLAAVGDDPSQLKQRVLRMLGESMTQGPHCHRTEPGGLMILVLMLALTSIVITGRRHGLPAITAGQKAESRRNDNILAAANGEAESKNSATDTSQSVEDQTPAQAVPIKAIFVEGNAFISESEIRKRITLQPGVRATARQIKDDIDALVRTRWFTSVEPVIRESEEGIEIVFQVLERPLVRSVEFKGLRRFKQKVFENLTQLKPGCPFDVSANRECARRIEDHYHEKGFAFATVVLEKGNNQNDREVVFQIHEGPKMRVTAVQNADGELSTSHIASETTRPKTRTLTLSGDKNDPKTIQADLEGVRQYYHALGYFDAEVREEIERSTDGTDVTIKYVVDEGVRYRVRNVEIKGCRTVSEDEIRGLIGAKSEVPYLAREIQRDIDAIKSRYGEIGRIFAQVDAAPRFTDEHGIIDILFNIDEGKAYQIRNAELSIHPVTGADDIQTTTRLHKIDVADNGTDGNADHRPNDRRPTFSHQVRFNKVQLENRQPQKHVEPVVHQILNVPYTDVTVDFQVSPWLDQLIRSWTTKSINDRSTPEPNASINLDRPNRDENLQLQGCKIRNIDVRNKGRLSKAEIRDLMSVNPGSIYDADSIQKDVDAIRTRYCESGRIFCQVEVIPRVVDQPNVIDLIFQIDPGQSYVINGGESHKYRKSHDHKQGKEPEKLSKSAIPTSVNVNQFITTPPSEDPVVSLQPTHVAAPTRMAPIK